MASAATLSLPVPVEVLETVLRFVPVNESFWPAGPKVAKASHCASTESREDRFRSVRINKFWHLQFAYKQWLEIVQLHLGAFELKLSATCSPTTLDFEEIEKVLIWNQFVVFNLNKEIDGMKGLDHLRSSYLNCYVASVRLFYEIPPTIPPTICEAHLTRHLARVSALFSDQQLSLDLCLKISENPGNSTPGLSAAPPVFTQAAMAFPKNISFASLTVLGTGPYASLLPSLLLTGQASIKSVAVDMLLSSTISSLSNLTCPCVTSLKLGSYYTGISPHGVPFQNVPLPLDKLVGIFPNMEWLQLPRLDPHVQQHLALLMAAGGAGGGVAMYCDFRPLTLAPRLGHLEFAWPANAIQAITHVEHEPIKSLSLRVPPARLSNPFDVTATPRWLRVGKCLEELELIGLSHGQLWEFAKQTDALAAHVSFSKITSVKLSIDSQEVSADDHFYVGLGFALVCEKFQDHFTSLAALRLELKPEDVPDKFSRFVLENIPGQIRVVKLVNIFQNRQISKLWKTWIFEVVESVANSLPRADHVEIVCSAECFSLRYKGLLDICQTLAEDSRCAYFDFAAYLSQVDSVHIRRVNVSKEVRITDERCGSINADFELDFIVKKHRDVAAHKNDEQKILFRFKDVLSAKK